MTKLRARIWRTALAGLASWSVGCGAKTALPSASQEPLPFLPDCSVPGARRPCTSICGEGEEECIDGEWQNCDAPRPKPPRLDAVIRDFSDTHPDFERLDAGDFLDEGIVAQQLGADGKPVYAGMPNTRTTTGRAEFDQWYHDGLASFRLERSIQLFPDPADPDVFIYRSSAFFPIDGDGFGNEGRPHNYHFTLEAHTAFRYVGGEQFSFAGDDDLWIFINGQLVIDLGGYHSALTDTVNLDAVAERIDLIKGEVYPLDLFFAERHTVGSNFNVRTSIAEFAFCE